MSPDASTDRQRSAILPDDARKPTSAHHPSPCEDARPVVTIDDRPGL